MVNTMNKLENLIQELCPQGVERKRLGDIGVIVRGNGLQKKDFTETGVGCIHYGQIYTYYGTCAYKTKSFVSYELAEKLQKVNKGDLVIAVTSENVEDLTTFISGGAQPKLNQKNLNKIPIPIPSQEKQKDIVAILDRFDNLCNDLTTGLPAEIEARKKQYEYYRDKLLAFKELDNCE